MAAMIRTIAARLAAPKAASSLAGPGEAKANPGTLGLSFAPEASPTTSSSVIKAPLHANPNPISSSGPLIGFTLLLGRDRRRKVRRPSRSLLGAGALGPSGLEQEPCPALGLVDPVLDQAGRGDVAMLVAQIVRLLQVDDELRVVGA